MALDDRYALAAITAQDLAQGLAGAAGRLPLAAADGRNVKRTCFAVASVMAPAIRTPADVAAIGRRLATAAALLRGAGTPADRSPVFYDAATASAAAAPTFTSPARTLTGALGRRLGSCLAAAWLGEAFVAEAQTAFGDRQSAIAARQRVAAAMESSIDAIAANTDQKVTALLGDVARTVSEHIAKVAADLRPVVRVQTPRSAPSSAIAYALYGDPSRAPELVARNLVATPLFMPTSLDALAPDAA